MAMWAMLAAVSCNSFLWKVIRPENKVYCGVVRCMAQCGERCGEKCGKVSIYCALLFIVVLLFFTFQPLLMSNDLRNISKESVKILKNRYS